MPAKKPVVLLSVLLLALITRPDGVFAHGGAKGIVKERMAAMETMGKAMKYVSAMLRGDVQLDMHTLDEAAKTVALHGQQIPELFPEGSRQGVSEASPNIWMDFQNFRRNAEQTVSAARALSSAALAKDVERAKDAHRTLGKTCSECHTLFRVTKNKRDKQDSLWSRMADSISDFFAD